MIKSTSGTWCWSLDCLLALPRCVLDGLIKEHEHDAHVVLAVLGQTRVQKLLADGLWVGISSCKERMSQLKLALKSIKKAYL